MGPEREKALLKMVRYGILMKIAHSATRARLSRFILFAMENYGLVIGSYEVPSKEDVDKPSIRSTASL